MPSYSTSLHQVDGVLQDHTCVELCTLQKIPPQIKVVLEVLLCLNTEIASFGSFQLTFICKNQRKRFSC